LREVAEEFAPLARPRGVEIVLAVDPDLPALRGDALRLGQVLRNLVGNALRYSPDGAQIILRAENAGKELQLMVEDAGVGIPPEELGLIFDKFVQSSKTNTGAGGTGLGLAICREIVAAHAGRIMAENRAEGGARFRVCLPWQA
jgi:signal transduction histidine kinase